jgi:hypothetical protein
MDIFKFSTPHPGSLFLNNGEYVRGIKTVMWVDRYRDPGEVTITANVDSGIIDFLPIGTLISHTNSDEVMIIENHEVSDAHGGDLEVTITGRSLETILEQRVVGTNQTFPAGAPGKIVLPADYSWIQAVKLIKSHIDASLLIDTNDALNGIVTFDYVWNTPNPIVEEKELRLGELYSNVIDILKGDDLGIAVVRPFEPGQTTTSFVIHDGTDLTKDVVFSFDAGDITNADYLWSNKSDKNTIYVISTWSQIMVKSNAGYKRRVTILDASELDKDYQEVPPDWALAAYRIQMKNLGELELKKRNPLALSKAQAAINSKKYVYRNDFKVGDIVTIDGMFNESATMRVVEYVEVLDENGVTGYPTLSTWPTEVT